MEPSSYASEKKVKTALSALSMRLAIPKTDWLPRTVMKAHFAKFFG